METKFRTRLLSWVALASVSLPLACAASGCQSTIDVEEIELAANRGGALLASRHVIDDGITQRNAVDGKHVKGSSGSTTQWGYIGLEAPARLHGAGAIAEDESSDDSFAVAVDGPGASTFIHGDPHTDDGGGWDVALDGILGGNPLSPLSFGNFGVGLPASPQGARNLQLDRQTGQLVHDGLWTEEPVVTATIGNFGDTPGLNGGDMVLALGNTDDCNLLGNADRCVVDVLLDFVDHQVLFPAVATGRPEAVWSDGVSYLALVRDATATAYAVRRDAKFALASEGGCTSGGFDRDGSLLMVRVLPQGVELFEAGATAFKPTAWREARVIDADLDRDGWFDTVCALAADQGEVWVAWVERDPVTRQHGNVELRKIVDFTATAIAKTVQPGG